MLPSEPRFDSNCITPGTDFMARLHEHLKYFVNKKLSSDPTWQKVEIILSGHDVSTVVFRTKAKSKVIIITTLHQTIVLPGQSDSYVQVE